MARPSRLSFKAYELIRDPLNTLHFSVVSIWEVAIKSGLGRASFQVDPDIFRRGLLENGYMEVPITGRHAAAVRHLPDLHKDPFDRMLVVQGELEDLLLLTADAKLAAYPGPIRRV